MYVYVRAMYDGWKIPKMMKDVKGIIVITNKMRGGRSNLQY